MDIFDAMNHALTTASSGGYSTKNNSIAYWNSPFVEYLIAIFMCISATSISLFYFTFKGQGKKMWNNEVLRWFYSFVLIATLTVTVWLVVSRYNGDIELSFRKAFFHVTSLISTSGFRTDDYSAWGSLFTIIAIILMTICGCSGSTSGGLKMGRFVILLKNMSNEFKRQVHPNAVIPVRVNGHAIPSQVVHSVLTFTSIYMGLIMTGYAVLLLGGMPFDEALGTAISAVSNVGVSIGKYDTGFLGDLPSLSKWTLSFLMIVGRLEIFTILSLFLPSFWRE
jgi:trk system potassium uptake protein TrkH